MSRFLSGVRGRVLFTVLAITAGLYSTLGAIGFLSIANGGKAAVGDRINAVLDQLESGLAGGSPTVRITTPDGVEALVLASDERIPSPATSEVQVVRQVRIAGTSVQLLGRASDARLSEGLRSLHTTLWIGIPVAILLTAAMAGAATGRALRPVADIIFLAGSVGPGDATTRVAVPDTDDEIEDLARTMNEMLDRIGAGMSAHRRFTSDAAHELRTPLMALQGEIELAQAAVTAVDGAFLDRLSMLAARLGSRVDELLLLSSLDEAPPLQLQPTCLLDLLHAEVAAIPGVVVVDGDRAGAMVDRDLMSRAVRNLLTNAQRHTRQAVNATVTPEGRRAWLHVDDDGPGIDPADRDQVFQRFRRLDEARSADGGGAGLGLSIVASIVHAHGGDVAIGTSPMGGARFSLWVPLSDPLPNSG